MYYGPLRGCYPGDISDRIDGTDKIARKNWILVKPVDGPLRKEVVITAPVFSGSTTYFYRNGATPKWMRLTRRKL
jgi:hypothetical protein